jgi:hypothetical protein
MDLDGPRPHGRLGSRLPVRARTRRRLYRCTPEAFAQNLRGFGLPDSQITDIFALFDVVTAGYAATVTADVAQLRGRAPRTIADFAHDYRALFS